LEGLNLVKKSRCWTYSG